MKKQLLVFLLVATVAQAETYRWTDNDGTVHFSDSLGNVPVNYRNIAKPTNSINAVSTAEPRQRAESQGSIAPQVEDLKGRMLQDEGVMALISSLQNDPEMQALLGDPVIIHAIQAGDIGTLINNPDFLKLLNNPRVREIENRIQQGGMR
jgi:hypothetical protein